MAAWQMAGKTEDAARQATGGAEAQGGEAPAAKGGGGGGWTPPGEAAGKVPSEWGAGSPTNKGVGTRWQDPANPGNGIRIDQGNPANSQVTQQVDHVIVRSNGQVIGRSGAAIPGSIAENAAEAHIPLSEWLNWSSWNHP